MQARGACAVKWGTRYCQPRSGRAPTPSTSEGPRRKRDPWTPSSISFPDQYGSSEKYALAEHRFSTCLYASKRIFLQPMKMMHRGITFRYGVLRRLPPQILVNAGSPRRRSRVLSPPHRSTHCDGTKKRAMAINAAISPPAASPSPGSITQSYAASRLIHWCRCDTLHMVKRRSLPADRPVAWTARRQPVGTSFAWL